MGGQPTKHRIQEHGQEVATTDSGLAYADTCVSPRWLNIHLFADASAVRNSTVTILMRMRFNHERQRGITWMYDGGMNGGWAHLAQRAGDHMWPHLEQSSRYSSSSSSSPSS
jgi:hypothetical protein